MGIGNFLNAKGGALAAALVARLDSAVAGRFFHACIISGGSEGQRDLAAEALAAAAVCTAQSSRPCMACRGCRKALAGTHPDILRLRAPDGKKTIPVASVRAAMREMALKPGEAPRKVIVIYSAELLGAFGQNALLATLEEPQGDALFLLVTENERALLETVRSRCAALRLGEQEVAAADAEAEKAARAVFAAYCKLLGERGSRGRAEARSELCAAAYRLANLKGTQLGGAAEVLRAEAARSLREKSLAGEDGRVFERAVRVAEEAQRFADANVSAGHISGFIAAELIEQADKLS